MVGRGGSSPILVEGPDPILVAGQVHGACILMNLKMYQVYWGGGGVKDLIQNYIP